MVARFSSINEVAHERSVPLYSTYDLPVLCRQCILTERDHQSQSSMAELSVESIRQDKRQTEKTRELDSVGTITRSHEAPRAGRRRKSVEQAYDFLHQVEPINTDEGDPRSIRRSVDKVILPIMFFLFFFHYLGM